MAQRTLKETVDAMADEARWHKREAERCALVASQTVVTASKIAAVVEQEKCLAVHAKLSQWAKTFTDFLAE